MPIKAADQIIQLRFTGGKPERQFISSIEKSRRVEAWTKAAPVAMVGVLGVGVCAGAWYFGQWVKDQVEEMTGWVEGMYDNTVRAAKKGYKGFQDNVEFLFGFGTTAESRSKAIQHVLDRGLFDNMTVAAFNGIEALVGLVTDGDAGGSMRDIMMEPVTLPPDAILKIEANRTRWIALRDGYQQDFNNMGCQVMPWAPSIANQCKGAHTNIHRLNVIIDFIDSLEAGGWVLQWREVSDWHMATDETYNPSSVEESS